MTDPRLTVPHGFFTRQGGVSEGPYASLNASVSGQDDPARVRENRARAAYAIGRMPESLVGLTQVHGVAVATVIEPWATGQGPRADAAVTCRPGVTLGIVTADCAPVLFVDPTARVIGAAHAGWRGAVAGVLEATVAAMVELGAARGGIRAAIGPCIGPRSYEIGPDVRDAALSASPDEAALCFEPGRAGHWWFALAGYCRQRLRLAGIEDAGVVEADTLAAPDLFFSHRRRTLAGGGPIGHQISLIGL
jgi:hypothetical protein